jgi:hypothetical protein
MTRAPSDDRRAGRAAEGDESDDASSDEAKP